MAQRIKEKTKIKVKMDLDGYLEWLHYDSDTCTLVNDLCSILTKGCKPYPEEYPDTDSLFDGRYVSDGYIHDSDKLLEKGIMRHDEQGDVYYFDENLQIEWV